MYNLHVHTVHSHDGHNTVDEMCEAAIKKGLKGIAFTDHDDLLAFNERNIYESLLALKEDVFKAKEKYKGKLTVLFGMELGEEYYEPELANKLKEVGGFDVILGSPHFFKESNNEHDICRSDIPTWQTNRLKDFLSKYISILTEMAKNLDFDVLAHITYPLRYINLRYKNEYDYTVHNSEFETLLKAIIDSGKSLELNTSNSDEGFFMPDENILKIYKKLGGKMITLGADSHRVEHIDKGLSSGIELLKKCGFDGYYYYEKRTPIFVKI